jgi:hypothetical protein
LLNRIEGLGFSIYATARVAPRDDLQADLRSLAKMLVTAARDARSADTLLRDEDVRVLRRWQAKYRDHALVSDHHLLAADTAARQIAALTALATKRQQFEKDARSLEPRVRTLRTRIFDARLDSATLDDLVHEIQPLREAAELLWTSLHDALEPAYRHRMHRRGQADRHHR